MHQEDAATGAGAVRFLDRARIRHGQTQFLYNLLGNTQMTRNVRQMTKSVNPKELAVWPLKPFMERLWE